MTDICYSQEHPERIPNPGIRSLYRSFEAARWRDDYGLQALDIWNLLWLVAPELDDLPVVEEKEPLPEGLRSKVTAVCMFMVDASPEFRDALRIGGAWQALKAMQAHPHWGTRLAGVLGAGWEARAIARLPEGLDSPFVRVRKPGMVDKSTAPGVVIAADFRQKH